MIKKSIFWIILIILISPVLLIGGVLFLFLIAYVGILYGYAFPANSLVNEYQRYLYFGGMRSIWQGQAECVDFDKDLLYVPRIGACKFKNMEFVTELNFENSGRRRPENITHRKSVGVVVIGDSHAMGWGVSDQQTFSYILEESLSLPVYNLSVSSYGTARELLRLDKSGLLNKVDTIIIQYCDNDLAENTSYSKSKPKPNVFEFERMLNNYAVTNPLQRSKDWVQQAFLIAYTINFKESSPYVDYDFQGHFNEFANVIRSFHWTRDKKIIVFYSNGHGSKFKNFDSYSMVDRPKLKFIDVNFSTDDYFLVDDHINQKGHRKIANKIAALIE